MISATGPDAVEALRRRHKRLLIAVFLILGLGALAWASKSYAAETLFVLAVAPALFILWHFHHADKYTREPIGLLLWTFALGGALAFVAALIETLAPKQPRDLYLSFVYFLFAVGLVEELAKFAAVRLFAYRARCFDRTMDGVIFGVTAAMGFATVENLFYVYHGGAAVALFRAFVSVPGHAFYGAIMGYFLAQAKIQRKWWIAAWGLAVAIFFHALFDTLAGLPVLVALVVLPGLTYIIYFAVVKREVAQAVSESATLGPGP